MSSTLADSDTWHTSPFLPDFLNHILSFPQHNSHFPLGAEITVCTSASLHDPGLHHQAALFPCGFSPLTSHYDSKTAKEERKLWKLFLRIFCIIGFTNDTFGSQGIPLSPQGSSAGSDKERAESIVWRLGDDLPDLGATCWPRWTKALKSKYIYSFLWNQGCLLQLSVCEKPKKKLFAGKNWATFQLL